MTKNCSNNQGFRTRFIYTCNQKVAHIETLLATSKQKAAEVSVCVLSRECHLRECRQKRVPLGSKVHSCEVNHRSYAEVVKAGTHRYNTKLKPTEYITNLPVYDQKAKNVNTTVTNTKHKGNAIDVVPNGVYNPVDDTSNDTHSRDQDKGNSNYDHSQECKIFAINGLDKYLHSILTVSRDKKPWKKYNNLI